MKLIFMGKQGSGKGTQAKIIAEKLGLCHISTGDLFRNCKGELGKKIHSIIDQGNLIDDELTFDILKERISQPDCKNGFLLDGFPRNLAQAILLEEKIGVDLIIDIYVSDELVIERLVNRLNCEQCGAIFNSITRPPIKEGICDVCGGSLFVREDDNKEAIEKRLQIYHENNWPILDFFKNKMIRVDGSKKIYEVGEEILRILRSS